MILATAVNDDRPPAGTRAIHLPPSGAAIERIESPHSRAGPIDEKTWNVEKIRGRKRSGFGGRCKERDEISIPGGGRCWWVGEREPTGAQEARKRTTGTPFPFAATISNSGGNVRIYNWWHVMGFSPRPSPPTPRETRPQIYFPRPLFHTLPTLSNRSEKPVPPSPRLSFSSPGGEEGGRGKCISPLVP